MAILYNHEWSILKGHSAEMERLEGKIDEMEELLDELAKGLKRARQVSFF